MDNAYVGILLNASTYRGIPLGRTQRESLSAYEEAGQEFGVTPCFLQLKDIQANHPFTMAYVKTKYGYMKKSIPTPKVIHNRAMYFNASANQQIQKLTKSGIHIFNQVTRYGKLYIHQLLQADPHLLPHLPETMALTSPHLRMMMNKYDRLILKPNSSSLGRGLMKLQFVNGDWFITYPSKKSKSGYRTKPMKTGILPAAVKTLTAKETYLVQEYIPLAKYQNRPFDLRVSVQRNETGRWQVTGIIARVAAGQKFVTNLARGGHSYTMQKVLSSALPHVSHHTLIQRVHHLTLQIASRLQIELPYVADIGLDIGITEDGFPQFIECNGRDARYSFREAGLLDTWKATFRNPIGFASYLLQETESSKSGDT
jgi:hypothetical protein